MLYDFEVKFIGKIFGRIRSLILQRRVKQDSIGILFFGPELQVSLVLAVNLGQLPSLVIISLWLPITLSELQQLGYDGFKGYDRINIALMYKFVKINNIRK